MLDTAEDIVVGFDGSDASAEAAAWGLTELVGTGGKLILVAVVDPERDDPRDLDTRLAAARDEVSALASRLADLDSSVTVVEKILTGSPAEEIAALCDTAACLAIGHHGSDEQVKGRIGTTSFGLPGHALSPVCVHRPRAGSEFDSAAAHALAGGGVVVGLDASDYARVAALDAAAYAHRWGLALTVLVGTDPLGDPTEVSAQIADDVAWLQGHFPELSVETRSASGDPAELLIDASEGADLLVLGKRGAGGFAGMSVQLGATSSKALSGAHSSVLLVPYRRDPRLPSQS